MLAFQNLEDTQDFCRDNNIPHILLLKDIESGTVITAVSHWHALSIACIISLFR